AYGLRLETIAYRWHPLFGRTVQVSPFRRGKDLTCIYTDERPDLSRELPNWMFDQSYCAGMTLGQAEVSIDGLNELLEVIVLLGGNQRRGAQSRPSRQKEKGGEEKPMSRARSARSRAGASETTGTSRGRHEGTGRGPGGSSAGGTERGRRREAGNKGRRR